MLFEGRRIGEEIRCQRLRVFSSGSRSKNGNLSEPVPRRVPKNLCFCVISATVIPPDLHSDDKVNRLLSEKYQRFLRCEMEVLSSILISV